MKPHKNNHNVRDGLADRLSLCVDKMGGKRALAAAALISEAQLFRYLNGESDMPSDRLVAVATAAHVDAGWLLTGTGAIEGFKVDLRPSFKTELMVQVVQLLEELLVEFEKPFSPRQRARAITFVYNALRHEERRKQTDFVPQKFDALKYLNFLSEMRTEEELEVLINGMDFLEYSGTIDTAEAVQLLRTWCNLQVRGIKSYYSSYTGQVYFERKSGGALEPDEIIELQNLVMKVYKITGKNNLDWLDLGCGNGQHMIHLHKHMPNIQIKGIELSDLGYKICKELMESEKLPAASVSLGDMRQMPYASQSFDVVFANMSLHSLPYIPGTGLGLEEALTEVHRVLRPGGVLVMVMPEGSGREYLLPRQYLSKPDVERLAGQNFEVADYLAQESKASCGNSNGKLIPNKMQFSYNSILFGILKKK